jgi:hypothetical protein
MIIIRKLNSIFYDNVVVDNFFRIFLGIKSALKISDFRGIGG